MSVVLLVLHAALMAGAAVLLAAALPRGRALLAGHAAPPFWQTLHTARRLLRKRPVVTEAAGPLLLAAPPFCLAVTAVAALLVPSFTLGMATAPLTDLVVVAGLLGLCRAVDVLAALDAGTAPAGLAAVRAVRVGALACPAFLVAVLALAAMAGTTNLDAALAGPRELPALPLLLAGGALAAVALAVSAEDPPLAAELSGWQLAAADATVALRRVVWLSLVAALVLPGGLAASGAGPLAWLVGVAAWAGKLAVLAVAETVAGHVFGPAGERWAGPVLGTGLLLGLLAVLFLFAGQTFA